MSSGVISLLLAVSPCSHRSWCPPAHLLQHLTSHPVISTADVHCERGWICLQIGTDVDEHTHIHLSAASSGQWQMWWRTQDDSEMFIVTQTAVKPKNWQQKSTVTGEKASQTQQWWCSWPGTQQALGLGWTFIAFFTGAPNRPDCALRCYLQGQMGKKNISHSVLTVRVCRILLTYLFNF